MVFESKDTSLGKIKLKVIQTVMVSGEQWYRATRCVLLLTQNTGPVCSLDEIASMRLPLYSLAVLMVSFTVEIELNDH